MKELGKKRLTAKSIIYLSIYLSISVDLSDKTVSPSIQDKKKIRSLQNNHRMLSTSTWNKLGLRIIQARN